MPGLIVDNVFNCFCKYDFSERYMIVSVCRIDSARPKANRKESGVNLHRRRNAASVNIVLAF